MPTGYLGISQLVEFKTLFTPLQYFYFNICEFSLLIIFQLTEDFLISFEDSLQLWFTYVRQTWLSYAGLLSELERLTSLWGSLR